jgi:putative membrane protein
MRVRRTVAVSLGAGLALSVRPAFAHGGGTVVAGWSLDPLAIGTVLILDLAYLVGMRRLRGRGSTRPAWLDWSYHAGMLVLLLALVSPVSTFGDELLVVHMAQHLLLVLFVPPLLVWGQPLVPLLWALPATLRRSAGRYYARSHRLRRLVVLLLNPWLVWIMHAGAVWLWHLPAAYQAGLRSETVHIAQHLTFLLTALLFWWVVIHPVPHRRSLGYGLTILYLFAAMVQSSLLGSLLTLARRPWYPLYVYADRPFGWTVLDDQRAAGLIMWVPTGWLYAAAILGVLMAWTQAGERGRPRQKGMPIRHVGR